MAWWWLLLSLAARAEEPEVPGEELVIRADAALDEARAQLEATIEGLGYPRSIRRRDRVVYPRASRWKTKLVLYDDGRIDLRTPGITPMMVLPALTGDDQGKAGGGSVEVHGLFQGPRALRSIEGRMLDAVGPALARWRDALWARAFAERRLVRLEEVRRAWTEGVDRDGTPLATPADRRAALLDSWLHTADSPEGAVLRADLEIYFEDVVQRSGDPFTPEEIALANARRAFEEPLAPSGSQ